MKDNVTHSQVVMLCANVILTVSLIHFPLSQVIIAGGNSWLVFFFLVPFIVLLTIVSFMGLSKISMWDVLSKKNGKNLRTEKILALLFVLFVSILLLHDLQAFVDSMQVALLPKTPLTVTTLITILVLIYVARLGLGSIANFNELIFPALLFSMLLAPILLLNKMDLTNVVPIINVGTFPSLLQAVFNALPWATETIILLALLGQMTPLKNIKIAIISGTMLGLFLLYLIIFSELAIFGEDLMKNQSHPTISMDREMKITNSIDRLGLVLFFFWIPTVFSKMSLEVYVLYRCFNVMLNIKKSKSMTFLAPIGIGILKLILFKNVMTYNYFYLKNNNLGGSIMLVLEIFIVFFFIMAVRMKKRTNNY
ncbi:GerAB/ArcD/ProY family transporter [Paenibacillus qinlingensis]|uniref:GerAB/ArcD/ProY family transporter n=1 Tax=Paenibacillus qinlingensis TaxID=1837343 RepID=UPI00156499D2|nr:GerAB/ArcD/ProY family transporter [Paenibacillus qinlingensis]NQX59962.1 GerAB/ArcD/ProY family transporter [Paenibacillus qinlingensis]